VLKLSLNESRLKYFLNNNQEGNEMS